MTSPIPPPLTTWDRYGKTLAAIIIAVITAAHAALSDQHITTVEWVQIAIATALGRPCIGRL